MPKNNIPLKAEGIVKKFGSVIAVADGNLEVRDNEIVGLVGANASGKSTLIKTICGVLEKDGGKVYRDGTEVNFKSSKDARKAGIEVVFQTLALSQKLSVYQNVFLGREDRCLDKNPFLRRIGIMDKSSMKEKSKELIREIGLDINPDSKVSNLSGGQRQSVAIVRSFLSEPDIILMDEPMAGLSVEACDKVIDLIRRLKEEREISVLVVSHSIDYIQDVSDRIVVVREGKDVMNKAMSETNKEEIVEQMFGLC